MAFDPSTAVQGDTVEMKKAHPCGGRTFEIMYMGMDVRLKCLKCGSQIRLSRKKFGKMVRGFLKNDS